MADPAAVQQMVTILQGCMNPDMSVLKACEVQLDAAERAPTYVPVLGHIVMEGMGGLAIQQLAAIALTNYVKRHWQVRGSFVARSQRAAQSATAVFELSPEQRKAMQAAALGLLCSPKLQERLIIREVGNLTAKIARKGLDDWPELLPAISQGIQSDDPLCRLKFFTALHYVFYESYHAKVGVPRAGFNKLCASVSPAIVRMSAAYNAEALAAPSADAPSVTFCCLCHKIMTRALRGLHDVDVVQTYVKQTVEFLNDAVQRRMQLDPHSPQANLFDKIIKKAMKALGYAYSKAPEVWAGEGYLLPVLQLAVKTVAGVPPYSGRVSAGFILQCLRVIEKVLADVASSPATAAAFSAAFPSDALLPFTEGLLIHYLAVQPGELEMWRDDPEAFIFDTEAEDEQNVKEVASCVFSGLLDHCGDVLVLPLAGKINPMLQNPATPPAQIESALHAVGLGCYAFPGYLEDEQKNAWLKDAMRLCGHADKVTRRRAIWVIGQWLYEVPPEAYGEVYALLINILADTANDIVIRLTALTAFEHFVANELDVLALQPLLQAYFTGVMSILSKCNHVSLKTNGLESVALVITTIGAQAFAPFSTHFIQILQHFWQVEMNPANREQRGAMVMAHVLGALAKIVELLDHMPTVHAYVCNLVRYATDTANPDYQDLLDGGLALWYAAVARAPTLTPELMGCWPQLPKLLDTDFEAFDEALQTLHQYVILGGQEFMGAHGKAVIDCLAGVLASAKDEPLHTVCAIVDDMMIMFPGSAGALLPVLGTMLAEVEKNDDAETRINVDYLGCLCRVMVADKPAALQLLNTPERLANLVANALDLSDCVSRPDHRKLIAMALAHVLVPPTPKVLEQIDSIVGLTVEAVLGEEGENQAEFRSDVLRYRTSFTLDTSDEGQAPSAKTQERTQLLLEKDPVLRVGAREWLNQQLAALHANVGPETFNSLLAAVGEHNRKPLNL